MKLEWLLHPSCALKTAALLREPFLTVWEDHLGLSPVSYARSEGAEALEAAQQAARSYPSRCLFLLILQTVSNTEKTQKKTTTKSNHDRYIKKKFFHSPSS